MKDESGKYGLKINGELIPTNQFAYDGFAVPYITVKKLTGEKDGSVQLVLDGRFAIEAAEEASSKVKELKIKLHSDKSASVEGL